MDSQTEKAFLKKHPDFEIKSAAELKIPESISTGSISLDLALGVPLPPGITEFAGGKGVGKTSVALCSAYNASQQKYKIHYLNIERSVNELSLKGIPWTKEEKENVKILYPDNAEATLDYIETVLRSADGNRNFFVLDSVAALVSEKAMAESAGKEFMALIARLLSSWLPKAATLLERHHSVLLLVNQLRDSLNPYGGAYTTPGGKSKDFYSNEQVFFRTNKASRITGEEEDDYQGHFVTAEVTKNRFAPPYKKAEFPIFYLPGPHIDRHYEVAKLAVDFAIVEKSGAWIVLPDGKKVQGMPQFVSAVRENAELFETLRSSVVGLVS